jgi:hypothetical protein
MAVIETLYSVGDVVWHAGTTTEQRQHPCPDCNGTRQWKAVSPAGDEFTFACPRCNASYSSRDDMSLKYSAFTPSVNRLTIGSVRHDSRPFNEEPRTEYMCRETGVGSGTVYRESDLFADEAAALRAAEVKCAVANESTEWVAKRYAKTLSISDYQFSSAALKLAKDEQYSAISLIGNLRDLFASIDEAKDKDAVLEAVADYKRYHLERDQNAASAIEAATAAETTQIGSVHESAVAESQTPNTPPVSQ